MVWAAAGVSWLIGFVSIFLIAPTNSGMGIVDSYVLFQVGSNFGNVLALVFWSCTALLAGWLLSRRAGPAWIHAFLAYGVPAVISLWGIQLTGPGPGPSDNTPTYCARMH